MSASVQRKLQQAHQSLGAGDVSTAAALCEQVLVRAPRNPDALWLLGSARLMEGRSDLAVPVLERAALVAPEHGSLLESLGLAYLISGDYSAAERVLRKAAAIPGAPASVRMRLGAALLHQGQYKAAIDELERAIALDTRDVNAHLNLGRAYGGDGRWSEAAREFEIVLQHDPRHDDARFNLGIASIETGQIARGRMCFEDILAREPAHTDARERLAALLLTLGRYIEAILHLREMVRAKPADSAAHTALANALFQTGALEEAETIARAAIQLEPAAEGAFSVMAQVHYIRGDISLAAAALEEGYARTAARPLLAFGMHLFHRMCDWEKWQSSWRLMAAQLDTVADLGSPFWLLCEATTPAQQLSYTRRWAAARFENIPPAAAVPSKPARREQRLRVGYFSSDFQEHAVAHLLVEALELHDRERFEIYAYSYGPEDGSALRARLRAGIEHFVDISRDADDVAVDRIQTDGLDLLIDLRGYTAGDRLQIMARRPAPVQATWLGYPGTTGAEFIDYVIADEYLIPPAAERFYSERVLRMPICYQPNDRKREIAAPRAREGYGLPEQAFVFCCFNQSVKILPEVFARLMNLLRRVPESVLWILEDNRWARLNLTQAATAEGIAQERIVFAPRVANPEHLARFSAADLALDTFPYTSHTTASDALWLGCPLVALCGETFAARVSSSIASTCGLSDLVTHTLDEYEALAYRLATDASSFQEVRSRLARARETAPLFDSRRFARDLETLYRQITQ